MKQQPTTILTAVIIVFWLVTAIMSPTAAQILSPVVMLIIGYWFRTGSKNGSTSKNGAAA